MAGFEGGCVDAAAGGASEIAWRESDLAVGAAAAAETDAGVAAAVDSGAELSGRADACTRRGSLDVGAPATNTGPSWLFVGVPAAPASDFVVAAATDVPADDVPAADAPADDDPGAGAARRAEDFATVSASDSVTAADAVLATAAAPDLLEAASSDRGAAATCGFRPRSSKVTKNRKRG